MMKSNTDIFEIWAQVRYKKDVICADCKVSIRVY